MKKYINMLLICLILLSTVGETSLAASTSGNCGKNITWSLNEYTGVLTVSGNGAMDDYQMTESGGRSGLNPRSNAPWWNYRHQIRQVVIEQGVTHVGNDAFASYDNMEDDDCLYNKLESVSIAGSVLSIGDNAFSLSTALTDLKLSDGLQSIGDYAFWECYKLSSYTIPDSVTTIGNYAFQNIPKVTSVTIPVSVQEIGICAIGYNNSQYQNPPPKVEGFTIVCSADSAGEQYAITNGFPFTTITAKTVSGFDDVFQNDWFAEDVSYAVNKQIMKGTDSRHFTPNGTLTRGMVVTILYRLAGTPSVSGDGFSDVKASDWYGPAVQWASMNNIASGYSNGSFGPSDTLTREQFAVILYRYAQYKHNDAAVSGNLSKYSDYTTVSGYAREAMTWAVSKGIINGTSNTTLTPNGSVTRAQGAAILHRFDEMIVGNGVVTTTASPSAASTAGNTAVYDSLLEKYRKAINKECEWNPDDELGDPALYNIFTAYYPKPGYAFLDVDQDGVSELLLGPTSPVSGWGDGLVYNLYTYRNGAIVKILESAERDRYYLLENGAFQREWSGGASNSGVDYYMMESGTSALKATQNSSSSTRRYIVFTSF